MCFAFEQEIVNSKVKSLKLANLRTFFQDQSYALRITPYALLACTLLLTQLLLIDTPVDVFV